MKELIENIPSLPNVDLHKLISKVEEQMTESMTDNELYTLIAETAATMAIEHPDYALFAGMVMAYELHQNTPDTFMASLRRLELLGILSDELIEVADKNRNKIEEAIIHKNDFTYDVFAMATLKRAYLMKNKDGKIIERPQYMLMRVALGIHGYDIEEALRTYRDMSNKLYTHATPTLFNSGTRTPQMASCFLLDVEADSINGIYKTVTDSAKISQTAGGIGISFSKIRATGSYISGTNGHSNGIVPMLKVFNETARYVDQCFHKDTLIFTNRGMVKIKDIAIGDKVLTQKGVFKSVTKVMRYTKDSSYSYLSIDAKQSYEDVICTKEHPILALKGQKKGLNFSVIKNRLDKGLTKPSFEDAKDLLIGDFVLFPKVDKVVDMGNISEDDCRLYGIFIGDGSISKDNKDCRITINNDSKSETLSFLKQYCYDRAIEYSIYEKPNNCLAFRFSTKTNRMPFTRELLYSENGEKKIHPSFLFLPKAKSMALLKGIMETDGHIGAKEISLELTSKDVIDNLSFILYRFGVLVSGYSRDRTGEKSTYKDISATKRSYVIRIPKKDFVTDALNLPKGEYTTYFEHGGYYYSRIDNIEEVSYDGVVYDLEVEDIHSYTTVAGIAHNGGGKRKGSIAAYIEPWHADVLEFLDLRKNHGKEELRARDLFYALWIPDLFMKRVQENGDWSLFCPNEAKGLDNVWGEEFEALYAKYEAKGLARKTIKAHELWRKIIDTQIETGTPYMLYKDQANAKSNQQNLGTIRSSNLCSEIIEYTSPEESAVCNLASISLPACVKDKEFDFELLYEISRQLTRNLNKVIDRSYYPIPEAEYSNKKHRPIGIGVQGLADVFAMMDMPFDSDEAKELNKIIFETIYYGAVMESTFLAKKYGKYDSYRNSPADKGLLQFDLWGVEPSGKYDWNFVKHLIRKQGLRNSLLIAPMPTASTSQLLGNNECFEPYTSNIYLRRVLSGEFVVVNKHLVKDLQALGLWNDHVRNQIVQANGSVQRVIGVPKYLKDKYKTVWEISQKVIIDMAADRGAYVCQSQSMNIHLADPTVAKISSMHMYAWRKGLKTGMYYLRTPSAADAMKICESCSG